jgi:site-specific recombinase XerD
MHLDGFCAWLLRRGYSRHTIRLHLVNVSHLNEHLNQQKATAGQHLCSIDIVGFFAAYPSWCQHRRSLIAHLSRVRHSVYRFIEYLGEMGLFDPLLEPEAHQPLLDEYLAWMAHYQHAASGTLELRAQYLVTFLRWLGPAATPQGMATLAADDVEAFFLAYAQKVGGAARRSMQSTLRTFFRFCLFQGYLQAPLDLAVPTLRTYKLASVPRGLSDAQAQKVLQGVNRKTCVGRRDYAILQILFTYGVRGGQVRALRLRNN